MKGKISFLLGLTFFKINVKLTIISALFLRYLKLAPKVNRVLLEVQRDKSSKAKPPPMIGPEDEDILREIKDLLAPLERATKEVSSEKLMTLSKVIPVIKNLKNVSFM